jgi:hypothetical protein
VATRFDRIPVTKDHALAEALDRARPLIGPEKPTARLVHDLAIKGAEAVVQERRRRAEQLAWAAQVTTAAETPWDGEILERIDELAWGMATDAS